MAHAKKVADREGLGGAIEFVYADTMKLIKPYDATSPFEDECTVSFHWRLQDILNAVMHSGIHLEQIEEMFDEKNYERPFGLKTEDIVNGISISKDEVDRMYDWEENPRMALPSWFCLVGRTI